MSLKSECLSSKSLNFLSDIEYSSISAWKELESSGTEKVDEK